MRKLIAATFVSLDGIMQAPGGPEEDPTGDFPFGGWTVPFFDDAVGSAVGANFEAPFDLVLGRRTYEIFAAHWPSIPTDSAAQGYDPGEADIATRFNRAIKYVASRTLSSLAWQNSQLLGADVVAALRQLKRTEGPMLLLQGSSELIQPLLANDLVDELRLFVFPVVLGRGKRLFGGGAIPVALQLVRQSVSPSGVITANYQRAGDLKTGSFALAAPTPAEVERRHRLRSSSR